jgi:thiol-disulfide isomerase/thioredoxin
VPALRAGQHTPLQTIAAPLFPRHLPWVNVASAPSTLQRGRPLLVEFWDFCRPNSLRTLPYVKAWHERYAAAGLRVVGVHCPGFEPSRDEQAVRDAVARLDIAYPVLIDSQLELWREYENLGWPARYLFDGHARLWHFHYGEGEYRQTELEIQQLLGRQREPLTPVRPEDEPGARLAPQSEDQPGAFCGTYAAGGVWAVLDGAGTLVVDDSTQPGRSQLEVRHPGAYPVVEHARHTEGELELKPGPGVRCYATCFTPGVA